MAQGTPLLRPYFDSEELREVQGVLDSGWVSGGPKVEEFERGIAHLLGVRHVVAVTNCTAALHLSLLSLGIRRGDEVLVADYTFPATGHSVLYCGAKPVFVDVDSKTYNIDPVLMEDKITERTKAIIPVHTFGQPAEMGKILRLADDHGLPVIEDAACAFGAKYVDQYAGTMGDVGCFSFHARKGITTGEGGAVVTNNRDLAERIRHLSAFGTSTAWDREGSEAFLIPEFTEVGYNYKMSDIAAAIGVAQLRKLDRIVTRKQAIAKYWDERLEEIDLIDAPYVSSKVRHVYQSYVALVDPGISRDNLIAELKKRHIQAQIGTYASHLQSVYDSKDACPNSSDVFHRSIALPMYYGLTEEEIDLVASNLQGVVEGMR